MFKDDTASKMGIGKKVHEVEDAFAAQLENVNSEGYGGKLGLIRVLREFEGLVTRTSGGSTLLTDSEKSTFDLLLAIEHKAADLRRRGHEYHQTQQETVSTVVDLCGGSTREKSTSHHQLILSSRSLSAARRKQLFFEKEGIECVYEKLEGLYSGQPERQQELVEVCHNIANSMQNQSAQCQFLQALKSKSKQSRNAPLTAKELESGRQGDDHGLGRRKELSDKILIQNVTIPKVFPFGVSSNASAIHRLLVVAPEGGGKTHFCHEIESNAGEGTKVHPLNACSRTTGELEDNIISLFNNSRGTGRHILLMDDFDRTIGEYDGTKKRTGDRGESRGAHASSRALASFLAMIDSSFASQWSSQVPTRVLLACTAKVNLNNGLDRFDNVHRIGPPIDEERRKALCSFLGLKSPRMGALSGCTLKHIESTLISVVTSTDGLSCAEIAHKYKTAMMLMDADKQETTGRTTSALDDITTATSKKLLAMKESLQAFSPASLVSHIVDGFVDMRVLSVHELHNLSPRGNLDSCPLLGHKSDLAWKALEWNIVIPLSRAAELNLLAYGQVRPSVRWSLCGGVLLTGIPGSGKSTLARHCARFAAGLLPSVKLIEVSCSSMIHKEVGASERAIHRLFEFARSAVPCIVILDDVAIVSPLRGKDATKEGTMDRVLSTLLHEMDGAEQNGFSRASYAGMAIIGITRHAARVDPALLRPGRLGTTIELNAPDKDARRRIALRELESHFSEETLVPSTYEAYVELSEMIAQKTEGLSGASVIALIADAKLAYTKALLSSTNDFSDRFEMAAFLRSFIINYR